MGLTGMYCTAVVGSPRAKSMSRRMAASSWVSSPATSEPITRMPELAMSSISAGRSTLPCLPQPVPVGDSSPTQMVSMPSSSRSSALCSESTSASPKVKITNWGSRRACSRLSSLKA